MFRASHLAGGVRARDQVPPAVGHARQHQPVPLGQPLLDPAAETLDALAGPRGDEHGVALAKLQRLEDQGIRVVDLVDHHELGHVQGADLGQHPAHGGELCLRVRVRAIHHNRDQVRVGGLFQSGPEGIHQLVRQVPDEPDRVGERERAPTGSGGLVHGGVEGGEQRVLDEHPCAGQHVQQARLARVRVARDHHAGDRPAPAQAALRLAPGLEPVDLASQLGDLRPDPAPVGLDLGLTGTSGPDAATAGHPAARLPRQGLAPATQPRQHVLQLRQLDLRLAFAALGVLGEDVEDERGPVDHLDLDHAFEAPELARAELAVADHRVRAGRRHDCGQLARLARAHVGGGIDPAAALDQAVEHHRPRGLRQPAQLGQ